MLAAKPSSGAGTIDVTAENFDEVVLGQGRVPVLVAFWAPGCEPCSRLAPVLDDLATELGHRVIIAKVNVDEQEALATATRIRAVPTMHLIHRARLVDLMLGLRSKRQLRTKLLRLLVAGQGT